MANTFLTPSVIAQEALMILENNTIAANLFYRDYTAEFTGASIGDTVTIRRPASFTVDEYTSSISVQNITEKQVSLQLEKHFDLSVAVTAKQMTLDLNDFSAQVINPAMVALADKVDTYIYSKAIQIPNWMGTAGDPPDTIADFALANKRMQEMKVPAAGRIGLLNPAAEADALSIDAFHSADKRGDQGSALREASMGRVMKADWFGVQNVASHTAGVPGGSPTGTGSAATGTATTSTVTVASGGAAGTFKAGDLVSFAGDLDAFGNVNQYVVTADATLDGTGAGSITVSPGLRNAISTAAITVIGDHVMNIAGHPNGLALCTVPLELPMQGSNPGAIISNRGMSVRVVFGYDMDAKTNTVSFDFLCGAKVIDESLLMRVLG